MSRQPYAEQCTRVYTRTGRLAHLLRPDVSPSDHIAALCGMLPERSEAWRGTGSQDEHERAASLPLCGRCGKLASAADARYAKFGPQGCAPASSDPLAGHAPEAGQHAPASPPAGAGPRRHLPPSGVAVPRSSPRRERAAAETSPGPETRRPGPAAVRAGAPAPPGTARTAAAAAGGSIPSTESAEDTRGGGPEPGRGGTGIPSRPGQGDPDEELRAQQRDAWKRAQSGHSARQRAGRVTRKAGQPGPGMIRRLPPEGPGAA